MTGVCVEEPLVRLLPLAGGSTRNEYSGNSVTVCGGAIGTELNWSKMHPDTLCRGNQGIAAGRGFPHRVAYIPNNKGASKQAAN